VLRRRDSGESDRRLTLFSRERGRIEAVAKGARKGSSRLAGSSEPLVVARMNLARSRRTLFVTQVEPQQAFRGLRTDYDRLGAALALVELYAALLPAEEPFPEAFDLLLQSLAALEGHQRPAVALVWCQLAWLRLAGYLPLFDRCARCDAAVAEAKAFVSPSAGGYLCAEHLPGQAGFRVEAEVLYGLARTAELSAPPPNLKLAREALATLLPFWRNAAESRLPATEAFVNDVSS
jgi:DNA repair protein RecO (recombination protein O)